MLRSLLGTQKVPWLTADVARTVLISIALSAFQAIFTFATSLGYLADAVRSHLTV